MKSKIQGEGDYEAARRFNAKETQFVQSGRVKSRKVANLMPESPSEQAAVRVGKSRAKRADQDGKDATLMKTLVGAEKSKR